MTQEECENLSAGVNPFGRYMKNGRYQSWHGQMQAIDGASSADFTWQDVAEVIAAAPRTDTRHSWDGDAVGVVLLKDGRFASWETSWGPTGDGFSEDAYGGDADIFFAPSLASILRWGLTEDGRRTLAKQDRERLSGSVERHGADADLLPWLAEAPAAEEPVEDEVGDGRF